MNRPWPSIIEKIRSKYQIVAELDFLELDQDPQKMFHRLAAAYKDEYRHDEKILVYHYDTDYYVEGIGFCLHNFLQCLKFLNISPSVVLMITNHHGIEKEIKSFYLKNYVDQDYSVDRMLIFESNHSQLQATPVPVATDLSPGEISFPFICLFGSKRVHRVVLISTLKQRNILDKGICSWNVPSVPYHTPQVETQLDSVPDQNFYVPEFLTTTPFTRVNENWPLNQELSNNYRQLGYHYDVSYRHPLIVGVLNKNRFDQPAMKKAFLYVSTETVFQYPYPYLTEKTFRAILHKRPFVILGAVNSLRFLRDAGFKTFDAFWSEEYDAIQDPTRRMLEIVKIIQDVSDMSIAQQQELCYNMNDVLTHNFDHYVKHYSTIDLFQRLATI